MRSARPDEVMIRHGRLYWSGRGPVAEPAVDADHQSPLEATRDMVALVTVWLYLLFNWGFMQVRIPPIAGGGLPVGEIVLFLWLLTLNYNRVLGRLSFAVALLPFAVWWGFGVSRAIIDFMLEGAWALRDAAHVLESLFLLIGFVFANHPRSRERFFRWMPTLLVVSALYGFLYPVRIQLWSLSPTIMTGHGFEAPIIGSMANTAYLLIMAASYLILFHGNKAVANVIAVLLIGYTLAVFQARTLYLILIAVFGFMILYRRSSIGNVGVFAYLGGILFALIALFGLEFQGRLGASFSFDFLVQHFLAIFGIGSEEYEGVSSAAEGVDQRLEWWANILDKMLASPFNLLLGLGYGVPLTDFYSIGGVPVREPHNSYVTVFARTGIIGGIAWLSMMAVLVRRWHTTFRLCQELNWRQGENFLMLIMVYFLCIWILAIGEDGFEKPYNIIPFYFFWGVVLRFSLLLEDGEIGPPIEDASEAYDGDRPWPADDLSPDRERGPGA